MPEPTPDKPSVFTQKQQELLDYISYAARTGELALVECKTAVNTPVAVLCAVQGREEDYLLGPLLIVPDDYVKALEFIRPPEGAHEVGGAPCQSP